MALKRMIIDGYGQLELNQVSFRRTGSIEAQCALDATDFADVPAENGMLLAVDKVNRTIKFPVDDSMPIALNYTTEHMYDERNNSLKDFYLPRGTFFPRVGFLSVGERFTTNCLAFDDDEFQASGSGDLAKTADEVFKEAFDNIKTTKLYGGICENGAIKVSATKPTVGPVLIVSEKTDMPDGQFAAKFQVLTA